MPSLSSNWLPLPGDPVGQGRPRCTCRGGKPRLYDPEASRLWKERASVLIRLEMGKRPCIEEGPVAVTIEAYFRRPKSLGPGEAIPRPAKPDADNVAKCVLDAAQGRCFRDDAQVTQLTVHKFYAAEGQEPMVRFKVEAL